VKACAIEKNTGLTIALLVISLCLVTATEIMSAASGQILLNGRVKSIDLPSNTVVITDYEGRDFNLVIDDAEIVAKFRDGRIKVGDDVNVKYRIKDGKNIPFSLRKLAGC